MALLRAGEIAKSDETEHVRLDLRLRHFLPDGRVGTRATVSRQSGELQDCALESRRLREAASLETEDRHGDLPASSWLADEVAVFDHSAREEDLAKITASGHL